MAAPPPADIDPKSGFSAGTMTFHSLRRAPRPLPPEHRPLSFTSYAFSLLSSPLPSRPAFIDAATGVPLSYPQLLSRVGSLAVALRRDVGLSKGDVAFILAPASLDIPVLYLAVLSIGAVVCPANPLSTEKEIAQLVALSRASVAFAVSSTAGKLPSHITAVLLDSVDFRRLYVDQHGGSGANSVDDHQVRQSDTAAIYFSSGTTGLVKAVEIPHRAFIAGVAISNDSQQPTTSSAEIALVGVPLFHGMGLFAVLLSASLGETAVLMTPAASGRSPSIVEILRAAAQFKVTRMSAAPPVVVAMVKLDEVREFDFSALRRIICSGAPLSAAAAQRFQERFPAVDLAAGYGSSETGSVSLMVGREECRRLGSVGRLAAHVEVKIVDLNSGKPLPPGDSNAGEIRVRGPLLMKGYLGDEKGPVLDSEGFLRTGDVGYIDGEGFLYVLHRLKEMIKYKGYQIAPGELEQLLISLPDVADAAVIPFPDEQVGEIPVALVVRKRGAAVTEAEILESIAKQVSPYKKIRRVVWVESIPRSAMGKMPREELMKLVPAIAASRL